MSEYISLTIVDNYPRTQGVATKSNPDNGIKHN